MSENKTEYTMPEAFNEWWEKNSISIEPPIMEQAFKEIAFKGWVVAAEKCSGMCNDSGLFHLRNRIHSMFLPKKNNEKTN